MIPTIEQIVEDVAAGLISKSQAITWLHMHAQGAANDLRDDFAAKAMQSLILNPSSYLIKGCGWEHIIAGAYQAADAMLKARNT